MLRELLPQLQIPVAVDTYEGAVGADVHQHLAQMDAGVDLQTCRAGLIQALALNLHLIGGAQCPDRICDQHHYFVAQGFHHPAVEAARVYAHHGQTVADGVERVRIAQLFLQASAVGDVGEQDAGGAGSQVHRASGLALDGEHCLVAQRLQQRQFI